MSSGPNAKATSKLAFLGVINPQTVANTELFTNVIDLSTVHQVIGMALLGNMASEVIDFRCYRCASDGSSAVALTWADELAASATANDNRQLAINVRSDDLIASGARYVKFGLVTGGSTGGPAAVLALGVDARFGPASALNLASVVQLAG
jgi:hypothetical protein